MMIQANTTNAELLRTGYAAFAAGDLATVQSMFHPGIVWHVQRLGQLSGDHVGWPAVADFFRRTMELTNGTFRIEVLDVLANERTGAVVVRSMGERNGKRLDNPQVHLFTLDADQKVTEVRQYVGDPDNADDFWS